MVRFVVSLVLLLLSIAAAVLYEGGSLLGYVGVTALFIDVLVPAFAMLAVWRLSEVGHAFRDAFSRKSDAASRARSARIWDFTEKICYATGVLAFLVGGILVLAHLYADVAALGRAFGVALLAPIYGILLAIVCRILRARVEAAG
jgi:flagellar motor component MotA